MKELRNLRQIYDLAVDKFSAYSGRDLILPQAFKDAVLEINNNTISYNMYSAIIETKGIQNGVLSIYLPNQWFYIASYFTEFYNELQNFKKAALTVLSKERLKELNGKTLTKEEEAQINKLPLSEVSKANLTKFVTDYSWWGGAKTIDRGDFYVSPILSAAKLVNASQSFVAELCAFLSNRPDLVGLLNAADNKVEQEVSSIYQQIFYGAPGTGKSHKIKEKLAKVSKENIFRTTFHPDSDYSTFVGAYKPSTDKPEEKLYNKEELISKLTELKEQGVTYAPQKFGAQYWYSLKQLTLQDKKDILAACEMSDNYTVEFDKGIAVGEELLKKSKESKIIYKFIPQAFLLAYMRAYSTTDKVYLIIEEINRGNCAQIFGDLFQLLDRDEEGVSEYRIKADADLRAYLEEELGADSDAIKDGELCLPSNLYIYATMNTSDQSLFPIDSAFKRRWDWEYEPIKYKNINWVIDIEGSKYLWTSFQREINKRIFDATNSEDKMLGDYFVNSTDGVITEKILLNKILFYLWNDVCKDGEGDIFKTADNEDVTFSDLHSDGGKDKLIAMMKYLKVEEA